MHKKLRNEKGSITLEAALIVPIFLVFVLFLASLIRIAVADIALDRTVSQTSEAIAAHVYPAVLVKNLAKAPIDTYVSEATGGVIGFDDVTKTYDEVMKKLELELTIDDILGNVTGELIESSVRDSFREQVGDAAFKPENLDIEVNYTSGLGGAIEVLGTLEVDLFIPFADRSVILKKRAHEGLWSVVE